MNVQNCSLDFCQGNVESAEESLDVCATGIFFMHLNSLSTKLQNYTSTMVTVVIAIFYVCKVKTLVGRMAEEGGEGVIVD